MSWTVTEVLLGAYGLILTYVAAQFFRALWMPRHPIRSYGEDR
jgi:hypothetical protein